MLRKLSEIDEKIGQMKRALYCPLLPLEETFDRLSFRAGAPLYWTTDLYEQHALHEMRKGNAILRIPNKGIRVSDGPGRLGPHSVGLEVFSEKMSPLHEDAFLLLARGYPTTMDEHTGSFEKGTNCMIYTNDSACAELGFTASLLFKAYNV